MTIAFLTGFMDEDYQDLSELSVSWDPGLFPITTDALALRCDSTLKNGESLEPPSWDGSNARFGWKP
jgi:hypothetical protein